ncbi:hypothetical protein D3C73_1054050 [compost metagenome]
MVAELDFEPLLRSKLPLCCEGFSCKQDISRYGGVALHDPCNFHCFCCDIVGLLNIQAHIAIAYPHIGYEAFGGNRVVQVLGNNHNKCSDHKHSKHCRV